MAGELQNILCLALRQAQLAQGCLLVREQAFRCGGATAGSDQTSPQRAALSPRYLLVDDDARLGYKRGRGTLVAVVCMTRDELAQTAVALHQMLARIIQIGGPDQGRFR